MSATLKQYDEDPAMPLVWPSEKPGMQGGAELEGQDLLDAQRLLERIRNFTFEEMRHYTMDHEPEHRLHKSILNRYLEPFRWHTVVISSTEFSNFWRQRLHKDAMPEMRIAAEAMRAAYDLSEPKELGYGDWHTPYVVEEEQREWWSTNSREDDGRRAAGLPLIGHEIPDWRKISVVRCARVSYDRQGEGSIEESLKRFEQFGPERFASGDPEHSSPFEHVATPCTCRQGSTGKVHQGNFHGWDQLRHTIFGR